MVSLGFGHLGSNPHLEIHSVMPPKLPCHICFTIQCGVSWVIFKGHYKFCFFTKMRNWTKYCFPAQTGIFATGCCTYYFSDAQQLYLRSYKGWWSQTLTIWRNVWLFQLNRVESKFTMNQSAFTIFMWSTHDNNSNDKIMTVNAI